jgi:acyl carrier protein
LDDEAAKIARDAIGEIVGRARVNSTALRSTTNLRDFGLDSAGLMELAGLLEDRLRCRIEDHDLAPMRTFEDVVNLVRSVGSGNCSS